MIPKAYKPLIVFIWIYLALIVVVNLAMKASVRGMKTSQRDIRSAFQDRVSPAPIKKRQNFILPDNPIRYNITKNKSWNHKLGEDAFGIDHDKVLIKQLGDPKIASELVKSPKQIQNQRRNINILIKSQEEILAANSFDEQAQEKLRELYLLRSTLGILEKTIVSGKQGRR